MKQPISARKAAHDLAQRVNAAAEGKQGEQQVAAIIDAMRYCGFDAWQTYDDACGEGASWTRPHGCVAGRSELTDAARCTVRSDQQQPPSHGGWPRPTQGTSLQGIQTLIRPCGRTFRTTATTRPR